MTARMCNPALGFQEMCLTGPFISQTLQQRPVCTSQSLTVLSLDPIFITQRETIIEIFELVKLMFNELN